ncbi:hypothetical protein HaLaN_06776 [Haematococcus lacustris]|uniref:Uncharacterized protein n=1 Tax=Haematococcus lacustris TaxID=44745 RepID=A0A699YUC3_HAELA|nr:hypothetical protein HaLaN_06776 [Haematococcus lacustris]
MNKVDQHGDNQVTNGGGWGVGGTGGSWGADAALRACCKVVCRPRGSDQLRGRVVLVDEHRTSRISSAVNSKQPCEEKLDNEQPTRPWSQEHAQPVRGLVWCPVVAPRKPQQAPCSSQEATPAAASVPGPSTPPPAKRSKHVEAEQAAKPTEPTKAEQAAEPKSKAAKAKPALQPGSIEHAAHWGEQVAAAGAVLLARPGSSASQGQGVPWPGL